MPEEDKAAERSRLILELGYLLSPIRELANKTPTPKYEEYIFAAETLRRDGRDWQNKLANYVTVNTIPFRQARKEATDGLNGIINITATSAKSANAEKQKTQKLLKRKFEALEKQILHAIDLIPINFEPQLSRAGTPYSTYLKIYDTINTAKQRIHYFDRYIDTDFFHLYLRTIDQALEICLVTTKGNTKYGITNISAISKLTAQEFTNYRLIQSDPTKLHDRNLRIDDLIFNIGSSAKDAGKLPTNFTPAENTIEAHNILDEIINTGAIIY